MKLTRNLERSIKNRSEGVLGLLQIEFFLTRFAEDPEFLSEGDMRKGGDIFASIFFICIGVGFAVGGIRLHLGTPTEPQPGFFPFLRDQQNGS